ncbi:matrix metalloproteinase-2-like [Chironomus tepperi]|uniref:matrix metalloproteinase-2-like n=1 Tax=Chironomus tepperi TaxID=113505 RepID=UPI00391F9CC8
MKLPLLLLLALLNLVLFDKINCVPISDDTEDVQIIGNIRDDEVKTSFSQISDENESDTRLKRTVTSLQKNGNGNNDPINGISQHRKSMAFKMQQDSEEKQLIREKALDLPDRCNTSYDAIALIDDEVIGFRGRFMFSSKMQLYEIRSRWRQLSPRMTHVDAVYQTIDNKTLFFIGQSVYSFIGNKLEKTIKLSDLGIDPSVLKIDAIFRRPDNQRTYIFIGDLYHRFDEHRFTVTGYSNEISKAFREVYDMDTAFTSKDNVTYFLKNEYVYDFIDKSWMLLRIDPFLSGNTFMDCNLTNPQIEFGNRYLNSDVDHIGNIDDHEKFYEPNCDNPEIDLCKNERAERFDAPNSVGNRHLSIGIYVLMCLNIFISIFN